MTKIATIVGARPQFIKAATVSRAIAEHNKSSSRGLPVIKEVLVHTGQHYDENMSDVFFDELHIPEPQYNLGIGSDSHGKQTGKMLAAVEEVLLAEKPDAVLVYGDTNSTLAGALAASKLHIPVGHVEAGLRSYNRRMPEELNRIVADHVSNILFCPTETAVNNLRKEGITGLFDPGSSSNPITPNNAVVLNVGDVMYDSILYNRNLAAQQSVVLEALGLSNPGPGASEYCLATIHRAENTDSEENLGSILEALEELCGSGWTVVFPVHPRTRRRWGQDGVSLTGRKGLTLIEPVGYLDMLHLEKHAAVILTDSGGVQKEAFLLGVPCVTLRNETEWVETVEAGWNTLTGPDTEKIVEAVATAKAWKGTSPPFSGDGRPAEAEGEEAAANPYGRGDAARRIVEVLAAIKYRL